MPRKSASRLFKGSIHQFDIANWEPLMEIAGRLCDRFMWMGEIRLEDGTEMYAYKHHETRRYFHVAVDGRAFEYVSPTSLETHDDGYREISRVEAIHEAFHNWPAFHEGDEGFAAELETLDEICRCARRGENAEYDPRWLERQRRFELTVRSARRHEKQHDPGFEEVRFGEGDTFYGSMEDLDDHLAA